MSNTKLSSCFHIPCSLFTTYLLFLVWIRYSVTHCHIISHPFDTTHSTLNRIAMPWQNYYWAHCVTPKNEKILSKLIWTNLMVVFSSIVHTLNIQTFKHWIYIKCRIWLWSEKRSNSQFSYSVGPLICHIYKRRETKWMCNIE